MHIDSNEHRFSEKVDHQEGDCSGESRGEFADTGRVECAQGARQGQDRRSPLGPARRARRAQRRDRCVEAVVGSIHQSTDQKRSKER